MIIDEINRQVKIATDALQQVTFKMQNVIAVIYKIAVEDYQKEVVDTGMIELEDESKEDWIKDRFDYYLSEEFMND